MKRLFLILLIVLMTGCAIAVPEDKQEEVPVNPVNTGLETRIGNYIILARWGTEQGIYAVDLDKGELHSTIYRGSYISVSTTGDKILLYRNRITGEEGSDTKFLVIDFKGKILKRLDALYPAADNVKPLLSPDGKGIFYVGEEKKKGEDKGVRYLLFGSFGDGSVVKVPKVNGDINYLSFRDDNSLLYSRKNPITKRSEIFQFSIKDYTEERILEAQVDDLSPSLSPDGTKLAFLRFVNDKYVVYIKDLASTDPAYCLYKDLPVNGGTLKWSKDREYLSFVTEYAGVERVKLYSFKKEIVSDAGASYTSIFSQDGYNLAYVHFNEIREGDKSSMRQELYMKPLRELAPIKILELVEGGAYSKSIELLFWFRGEL